MAKTGFNMPLAIKKQKPQDKPKDGKNAPWDFTCPQYDQRTSCFINAGTHYGVGHKQPVGHSKEPKMHVPTLPFGKGHTLQVDEKE